MALLLLSQKSPYIYVVSNSESLIFFFQITPSHFGQQLENIQTHPKVLKKIGNWPQLNFGLVLSALAAQILSLCVNQGWRKVWKSGLQSQIVMQHTAASCWRLLFCQNLEWGAGGGGVRLPSRLFSIPVNRHGCIQRYQCLRFCKWIPPTPCLTLDYKLLLILVHISIFSRIGNLSNTVLILKIKTSDWLLKYFPIKNKTP